MLKLPLIISDKNLWLRCSSSSGRRVSACASVTTHYPPGRHVADVGQCTEWRAQCSRKVPTSTWKIKICTLVAKILLMVSLFSLEKSLKLPLVRIFLDFGQVLKFFNKEKGQVGTLYKYCPLQHGQTPLTCLRQVKMNDSAEFCCLAENSFGAANTTIVLIVEVSQ